MRFGLLILIICLHLNMLALSLEEAIEIGLKNSPVILSAKEALNQAKFDYLQANFDLFPTANIIGGYSLYDPELSNTANNNISYGVQANLPLFVGGRNWQNSRVKKNNYLIAENDFQSKKMTLINDIENKFYNVQEAILAKQIAEADFENATIYEEIAQVRLDFNTISQAEFYRVKSDTQQKMVRVITNQTSYLNYLQDLKSLLNVSKDIEIDSDDLLMDLPNDLFATKDIYTFDNIEKLLTELVQYGIDNNLNIQNNRLSLENLKKNVTTAMGNFFPSFNLSYRKEWQKFDFQDEFKDSSTLTLNASIPIFPIGNNTANYLKNKSNYKRVEYDQDTIENNLNLNIRSATLAWMSASQSTVFLKWSLEYSENFYQQTLEKYRRGVISSMELLDSILIYSNSRYQYINMKYNILRNKANLKYLLNIETDEQLNQLLSVKSY